MGLPNRKARRITVDGVDYDWIESVSNLAAGQCRINLVIEPRVPSPKRIFASCQCGMDRSGDRAFVTTPGTVAQIIRHVIACGWHPDSAREDYRLGDFDRVAAMESHGFYSPDNDSID